MRTKVDRFGRLVVPKDLRDRLGLSAGAAVEIEDAGDHLAVRPVDEDPPLVVRNGILLFDGAIAGDLDEVVRSNREARLRQLRGDSEA